jgi:hypothetical protein
MQRVQRQWEVRTDVSRGGGHEGANDERERCQWAVPGRHLSSGAKEDRDENEEDADPERQPLVCTHEG